MYSMRRKEDLLIQIKYREYEKMRKRKQRENNKSKKVINTFKRNSDKIRCDSNAMYKRKFENLKLELSVSKKINRNLKRKLDSPQLKSPQQQKYDTNTTLLENVSSGGKKKSALKRLKLSETPRKVNRDLHLYRLNVKSLRQPSITEIKIRAFLESDENSVS